MGKREVPEKQNCKQCGKAKSLKDFPSSFASRFGVRNVCKDCTKKNKRDWTVANAKSLKAKEAARHKKMKDDAAYKARKAAAARRQNERDRRRLGE